MTIDSWMAVLEARVAEVTGLKKTFGYKSLPATFDGFPCAVILFKRGSFDYSVGGPALTTYEVQIVVFTSAQILGEAHSVAAGFIEPMRNKIAANMKLSGTVSLIGPSTEAPSFEGPGQIAYADKLHTGVSFNYRVEVNETGSYTPAA
jgi:hypothetical protein